MIHIRTLGLQTYLETWEAMKRFTVERDRNTCDELWLLEHYPVYTQGQAGKAEHVLTTDPNIPVVQSDRGGQVTYHGPGQLVMYTLLDIQRRQLGVRTLVTHLEHILVTLLQHYHIKATIHCGAPGVYVDDKKIASIGLRVKNGCTYHGIALNVDMDLSPFNNINPCGFKQLKMTQMSDFMTPLSLEEISQAFVQQFLLTLGYTT